jgi:hypothetical protein
MATGILGQSDMVAATNTTLYTVPSNTFGVISVNFCNRGSSTTSIRLAVAAAGTPTNSEWIEYDADVLPGGVVERTGLVVDAGKLIVAYSSNSDCTVSVYGIETSTS